LIRRNRNRTVPLGEQIYDRDAERFGDQRDLVQVETLCAADLEGYPVGGTPEAPGQLPPAHLPAPHLGPDLGRDPIRQRLCSRDVDAHADKIVRVSMSTST
jgi:hypothetical protein